MRKPPSYEFKTLVVGTNLHGAPMSARHAPTHPGTHIFEKRGGGTHPDFVFGSRELGSGADDKKVYERLFNSSESLPDRTGVAWESSL